MTKNEKLLKQQLFNIKLSKETFEYTIYKIKQTKEEINNNRYTNAFNTFYNALGNYPFSDIMPMIKNPNVNEAREIFTFSNDNIYHNLSKLFKSIEKLLNDPLFENIFINLPIEYKSKFRNKASYILTDYIQLYLKELSKLLKQSIHVLNEYK